MIVIPATTEILTKFYGYSPKRTVYAFAAIEVDKILAVWGFHVENAHGVLFSDISHEGFKYKKSIVKNAKSLIELAKRKHLPLFAKADCMETAKRFLVHLGFVEVKKGIYLCQA